MAKVIITKEWKAIPYSVFTVDNTSVATIEVAEQNSDSGILVYPKNRISFKDMAMKIRVLNLSKAEIGIVNYIAVTDGGEDGSQEDEATRADIDKLFE